MFWTRLKNTESLVECLLIYDISSSQQGCILEYVCPKNYPLEPWSGMLKEFLISCGHKSSLSEDYVLIFTDREGKLEFVVCLLLPMSGYLICVKSFHPWFEFLHGLLTTVNQEQLYSVARRSQLEQFMQQLCMNEERIITVGPMNYHFPVPDQKTHPFYHRYILEYYNTLSISNWIVIMESLLLEKSIIFYSSRFQRITSCILASLSLLYPLTWVHLIYPLLPPNCVDYASCPSPFVAGIHSCMLEKVKGVINADVRLVDLDTDTVYVNGSFGSQLPYAIRQWLVRGCGASHQAILKQRRSSRTRTSTAAALLVEPYLELMTILLGGYREAIQYTTSASFTGQQPSGDAVSSPSFDRPRPGGWHFSRDLFISSRGRECQAYLRELLQSQMVVQFFESRVATLNSDLGMIPDDDFEEAISRVSGPPRSNLSDLLSRGRAGFSRFARKLKNLKKVHLNQRKKQPNNAHLEISLPFPAGRLVSSPQAPSSLGCAQTTGSDSAQGDSSSSSSSLETLPYNTLDDLAQHNPALDNPSWSKLQPEPDRSKPQPTLPPFSDAAMPNPTDRSRQSLVTSIFNAVPNIPPDWLQNHGTTDLSTPSLLSVKSDVPSASNVFGTRKHESTKRNCPRNDLLHAFDPYCPDTFTHEENAPETDLANLLKELDPLLSDRSANQTEDNPTDLFR